MKSKKVRTGSKTREERKPKPLRMKLTKGGNYGDLLNLH